MTTYRRRRDFARTAEPRGGETSGTGDRFVVQRHRARRRHYDLRLEHDGALLSWAVPKGPTLDPAVRRIAVRVEDHPLEYADFEGTIPAGEYGGGDVIVWDRGTWTPGEDDPAAALEAGTLHFELHGEKLRGHFVLVRRGETQWLLLHKRDEHAVDDWDPEHHPVSVKSGRTNEQVAAAPEAMWRGDLPADRAEIRLRPSWRPPTDDELAELAALGQKGTWTLQGERIKLTNLDKVLFPGRDGEDPITKRELIGYHARIAPVMLPYLADRALNSHRFPRGVDAPGFWHKKAPSHAPDWLRTWTYPGADADDVQRYIVPDSPAALAWLANYAALELHPWTSPIDDVEHPSWALFDIDPGERTSFDDVLTLARLHRAAMEHLGVLGKPKVTGQRGIQIWVPIAPRYSYAETREWVEKVSRAVGNTVPELVSWAWSRSERRGLARLDYTQNVLSKTLVAPYSARPRPGAPVSVPLEWDELDDPDLTPDRWTLRTVGDRVAERGDPFAELLDQRQTLPPV
ncbi:bifunctional non-homologous end joining protein LigD [Saccharopolyspora flava]|uniref:Bifunctional non-homologous end joining protein LigD n=1 Tax=Saccharopolyspora flava TaxID=95161 RepID=A0A1I6SL68_9PSEU|nr:bifunctional non-homologous end joining protein LigD [Saccharopolyspora flava]